MAFQAMNHGQDARATSNGACVLAECPGSAARARPPRGPDCGNAALWPGCARARALAALARRARTQPAHRAWKTILPFSTIPQPSDC